MLYFSGVFDINHRHTKVHVHSWWQFDVVLAGETKLDLSLGDAITLRSGDAVLLPPRTRHQFRYPPGTNRILSLKFESDYPTAGREWVFGPTTVAEPIVSSLTQLLRRRRVLDPVEKTLVDYQLMAICTIYEAHLSGHAIEKKGDLIDRAVGYVNANIHTSLKIDTIVHELGCSRSQLAAKFRESKGIPLKQYIDELKTDEIGKALRFGGLSIKELACEMGFCDASSMSKFFKQHTGYSPKEYRRRHSGGVVRQPE